jgi:hypothetical protein
MTITHHAKTALERIRKPMDILKGFTEKYQGRGAIDAEIMIINKDIRRRTRQDKCRDGLRNYRERCVYSDFSVH